MTTLERRIEKLETSSGTTAPRYIVGWQMPEDTQAIMCNGHRYERHLDESLDELKSRIWSNLSGSGIHWMDATM